MTGQEDGARPMWQSFRTLLEALILAALLWSAKTQIALGQQVAVMTSQLSTMNQSLAGVPELGTRVTKLEIVSDQSRQDIRELKQVRSLR